MCTAGLYSQLTQLIVTVLLYFVWYKNYTLAKGGSFFFISDFFFLFQLRLPGIINIYHVYAHYVHYSRAFLVKEKSLSHRDLLQRDEPMINWIS